MFRAVAVTVVPEASQLEESEWRELESIIELALASRHPRLRRQLVLFVRVIAATALLRHGASFAKLDAQQRTRLLEALQDSRIGLLRRGFWGLRTLIFMGYYARSAAAVQIGYRADPCGWEARP